MSCISSVNVCDVKTLMNSRKKRKLIFRLSVKSQPNSNLTRPTKAVCQVSIEIREKKKSFHNFYDCLWHTFT